MLFAGPVLLVLQKDAVLGSAVLCVAAVVNNLRRLMAVMHDNWHDKRSALEFCSFCFPTVDFL